LNPIEAKSVLKEVEEDLNILYVAATRAKKVLQPNFDLYNYLKAQNG
jgi:superfamily I DNA/RNA helicase